MIPFLVPIPITTESSELIARFEELESTLTSAFNLMEALLIRLEARLGPDFLGEDLGTFMSVGAKAKEAVVCIDDWLEEDQAPKATHYFRELAGVSWDQAHQAIGHWSECSPSQKLRGLQLAIWVRMLSTTSLNPENEG